MRYHSSNVFDKFPHHLRRYLLFDQRLTQNSVEKNLPKTGDFFAIAEGLEIGAK